MYFYNHTSKVTQRHVNNSFMEIIVTYQLLVFLLVHFLIWPLQWQQQTPEMQWSSLLDYAVMVSLKTDSKKFEEQKFPRSSLESLIHNTLSLVCSNNNQQKVVRALMKTPRIGSLNPGSNATFEFVLIYYLKKRGLFSPCTNERSTILGFFTPYQTQQLRLDKAKPKTLRL